MLVIFLTSSSSITLSSLLKEISTEALQMKVNFKINTLRGIFLCLTRNKDGLCPRTVFSQTQKIKNVCLKRRFQFVGKKNYKLKTPTLLPGKSYPIFTLRFAPVRPSLHSASKRLTLSFALPPILSLTAEKYKKKMQSGMIIYLAQVLSQS